MVARRAQEGLDVSRSALVVSRLPRAAYECAPAASDRSPGSRACRHHQAGRRSYAAALLRHASPALTDVVRLLEIFDTQSVSFVSVTQQFNTTSSMGRLT